MSPTRPAEPLPVRIEAENEAAWCGERRLGLTPRAFAVLRHLVEHPHRLITKDDLLATVWRDAIVSDAALASCIRDLRKALGDSSEAPRYIETVHRRGFRFIGPIASLAAGLSALGAASPGPEGAMPRPEGASEAAPTLVGREAELARLQACLERARSGQRQLVLVSGEPGIGKTALVEAFLARISGDGKVRIGRGQCVEQYGAGEPYLPVLEALGRLGREAGGEQIVQTLKQYAPTWLTQLPSLLKDRDLEAVQRRAQGATRDRMLRELVEALDALSRDEPLVLVLEDLHWSDSSTIELLARLARRREAARLLVLGTYRPADVAGSAHPLSLVKQELQVHRDSEEVPLEFLSVAAVSEYLSRRFPGHRFPSGLARALHVSTDGNPLFLVNAIEYLMAQGQVREVDGQWELSETTDALALGTPRTLSEMVERQAERLTPEEQAMLAVASVAGAEFSAAVAIAGGIDPEDGEERCAALARSGRFLRPGGVTEWPDGTVAGRYAFIHALYQQVLYGHVSVVERVGLHLRTGERLERAYGQRAGEIAGELAMHFEHGRDFARAARYRRQAAENALRQHAYREAADHATRALGLLRAFPESPERIQQELTLQVMLGAALTATQGYAAPEVARTYGRARELCAQVGDTPQLFPVLLGLGRFYLVRGEFPTARLLGTQLMTMGEATRDPTPLLAAHNALGIVSFYAGEFEAALAHLEQGIALYDPEQHSPNRSAAFRLGQDPGVSCTTHAALALWMLGYPTRAAARMGEALVLARSLAHPFSVAYACHFAAGLHQWRREPRIVQELEDTAFAHDTEHGFGLFLSAGAIQRGWLRAEQGQAEDGLAQMRQALARHRDIGAEVLVPAFLGLVAEVHGKLGQPMEGLSAVAEALTVGHQSGQHYWEAELHRLRGVLTLEAGTSPRTDTGRSGAPDRAGRQSATPSPAAVKEAETCFLEAIEIARGQRARSLELRAATSLSRLWASRAKVMEAHALLSDIYHWFTEGFDTADLGEAKSLLEELGSRAGGSSAEVPDKPHPGKARNGRGRRGHRLGGP
jgi:predicted ATPase/DNA-binding winged helix-turn-helix (wHTH) protein